MMSAKRRYERYARFDAEQALHCEREAEVIHWETGAGIVRCGSHMSSGAGDPGWNMSTASVSFRDVTCPACKKGLR